MDTSFESLETKTTLWRRACTALATLVLVLMLGVSGEAVALVSQSIDPDSGAVEKTISLTEKQAVIRATSRTKTQISNEREIAPWQNALCFAPCAIAAEGQVSFALPNGGRPRAVHPTGPPMGHI